MIFANDNVKPMDRDVLIEALRACEYRLTTLFRHLMTEDSAVKCHYLTRRMREMLELAARLEQRIGAELPHA